MCRQLPFLVMTVVGDQASSNIRFKFSLAEAYQVFNDGASARGSGRILYLDVPCAAHFIHRFVMNEFTMSQLVAKMFSVAFIAHMPSYGERLLLATAGLIREELGAGGWFQNSLPLQANLDHRKQVLALTILRPIYTRGIA